MDGQSREPLRQIIMKVPGYSSDLFFLRMNEPSGKRHELFLVLSDGMLRDLARSDVDTDSHQTFRHGCRALLQAASDSNPVYLGAGRHNTAFKDSFIGGPGCILRGRPDSLTVSFVPTSGTGSGKSLTYIIPIVDHILRNGSGRGIQAIVVYPMNALANGQDEEPRKFLENGYPEERSPVRFARYTGHERGPDRDAIRANAPDILLTNYMMPELLLTRCDDRQLVRAAQGLRFLVFDELHTYRGRQGADVAQLIRRCRLAFGA
jgi:hypothetical protein